MPLQETRLNIFHRHRCTKDRKSRKPKQITAQHSTAITIKMKHCVTPAQKVADIYSTCQAMQLVLSPQSYYALNIDTEDHIEKGHN